MNLQGWNKGDPLLAGHFQEPVDALNRIREQQGGDLTYVMQLLRRMLKHSEGAYESWRGVIADYGPDYDGIADTEDDAPRTDCTYWVKKQFPETMVYAVGATEQFAKVNLADMKSPLEPDETVLATNLAEIQFNCHSLRAGDVVEVWAVYNRNDANPVKKYFFCRAPKMCYGIAKTTITSGNVVTLQICKEHDNNAKLYGGHTPDNPPDVVCNIVSPDTASPTVKITAGDILAFWYDSATAGVPDGILMPVDQSGTLNVGYYSCGNASYTTTAGVANLYFGGPAQASGTAHDIGYVHPEIATSSSGATPNFTYYGHVWQLTVANATYGGTSVFPCSAISMDNSATGDDAVELTVADGGADGAGFGTSTGKKANVSAKIKNIGNITLATHWDEAAPGAEDGAQAPTRTLYLKDQVNGADGDGKYIGVTFPVVKDATTKKVTVAGECRAGLNDLTDVDLSANATYRDRTKHTMMLAYDANAGKWVRLLADEREVVTDVSWDAGNHTLKQTKRTLYVLGLQVGNATTSDIDVAVEDLRP